MSAVNGPIWRRCRDDKDLTSDQAAKLLGITGGALRQIELGTKPASGRLGSRAARLYKIPRSELFAKVGDQAEPEPAPKPDQPSRVEPKVEPTHPSRRRDTEEKRTGPKRASNTASAA